jgi:alpha-glucosidase
MSWWENAVVYQVYPRSFLDSGGDGEGDVRGVREHLDHVVELGADAIWLSPFYPSPLKDSGYDVSDYCAVDPRFGTMDDFDALIAAADERGLRVLVDIVPNHCSSEHPLFQKALAAKPGSPERELFIFRDEPNNWPSFFGGSAWTQVPDGQYYLHLFDESQPDWNWRNPAVSEMFEGILRFWLDRGAAGFRIDVGNALYKAEGLPDVSPELASGGAQQGDRTPYQDQPELDEHYRRWRAVLDSYGDDGFPGQRIMIGETWADSPEVAVRYVGAGMNQTFDFRLIEQPWSAKVWQTTIEEAFASSLRPGEAPWAIGNHDVPRIATRLGIDAHGLDDARATLRAGVQIDAVAGLQRARAAMLMLLALPGSVYVYQGDELGLPEVVDLPDSARQDPMFFRTKGKSLGRDGCRVPLPWSGTSAPFGFSPEPVETWLPQPPEWTLHTVSSQTGDPSSTFELYKAAIRHRRELTGELSFLEAGDDVVAYTRGERFCCFVNFGPEPADLPQGEVVLASAPIVDGRLVGNAAAWLRL